MLTSETLHTMTPEQRTDLFEKLCAAWYGDRLTAPTVAADFNITRETYFRWRKDHNVPWAVLFSLERWVNSDARAEQIIADWATIPAQLAEVSAQLSRITGTMARIARLSAVSEAASAASQPLSPESGQ